ncbi:Gfo/Idh/MocA family protein [Sunxiuqinia sp. sy24]|uniref:Gfo/Idh/MocA family protein n=1 Tax=Sunxiuqinia sp. sy24 TaxID=3461495 RepID=UPI004045690C
MKENISRRNFIRNTGLITAGGLVIPSVLSSCIKTSSPNDKINVAMIGVGGRGSNHVVYMLELARQAQIVAVCDPFENRRNTITQKINAFYAKQKGLASYDGCVAYNNFQEVLTREDVDAVVIATPDHWHVPIALAAAQAGKHIYLEKPLALSIQDGQKLRKLVQEKKVVFQYGTQQRSDSKFRLACELTRNEVIGKLEKIDVWCDGGSEQFAPIKTDVVPAGFDYDLWQGPAMEHPFSNERVSNLGAWFIYDYAIGFVAGWGAHPLDIAQWGNNSDESGPVEYEGTGSFFETDNLFNTMNSWDIKTKYANGVEMHFFSDDFCKPIIEQYRSFCGHGTTFFGTEGWVSVDREGIHASNPEILKHTFSENDVRLLNSSNHTKNFLDAIIDNTPTVSPIESAVRSDTISHLCNIMVRSGETTLKWDPVSETILDGNEKMQSVLSRSSRNPYGDILKS